MPITGLGLETCILAGCLKMFVCVGGVVKIVVVKGREGGGWREVERERGQEGRKERGRRKGEGKENDLSASIDA